MPGQPDHAKEDEEELVEDEEEIEEEEIEGDHIRLNWVAIWTVIIALILLGWSFGLVIHPPEAEVLKCESEDMVEIIGAEEGVVVFCKDYVD